MQYTIKPIPKFILRKIEKLDKSANAMGGNVRFYAYLTKIRNRLVKVTVAVKHKYKKFYCKQVAVHGLDWKECMVKDMEYNHLGTMGFRVGWYSEGLQKLPKWFESNNWCTALDRYYDPYAPLVNADYIERFDEFKYCGFKFDNNCEVLKYLRLYRRYPQIEMLVKLGFGKIAHFTTILKHCKDIAFCKWLIKNKTSIKEGGYINAILQAYKTNQPVEKMQYVHRVRLQLKSAGSLRQLKQCFRERLEELFHYLYKKDVSIYSYLDYFKACRYLEVDMSVDKNAFPHDFKRWHDIRIDEYKSKKALEDEQKRQQLFAQFNTIAKKYLCLEHIKKSNFICVIAKSPLDLVAEGEALHHCVGKMNYDQKFVREESLIFFVRTKLKPDVPLVTLEYSVKNKKVLQCYGEHDQKPNEAILHYVNKVWLPYANKTLNQLYA